MIHRAKDIKLSIRPVFIGVEHRHCYEGPCRFAAEQFQLMDCPDFWKKQTLVGNRICLVYGDYVEPLRDLAESLGVEVLLA